VWHCHRYRALPAVHPDSCENPYSCSVRAVALPVIEKPCYMPWVRFGRDALAMCASVSELNNILLSTTPLTCTPFSRSCARWPLASATVVAPAAATKRSSLQWRASCRVSLASFDGGAMATTSPVRALNRKLPSYPALCACACYPDIRHVVDSPCRCASIRDIPTAFYRA
jgi:hypothetical protein